MTFDYRGVMSGQRKDPLAFVMRSALRVAALPYGIAVSVRNRRFDRGVEVHRCGVPVISVGNLTTGGTGKTPIVCFLAKWLRRRDLRVVLVSRGYGRGEGDVNDEALELHDRLADVPHVQDPDRVEAARIAVEELEAQVVLMDDGLQHRRLYRDLNLVVIDATCPFGYGYLLPRGLLREPVTGLRRADAVIISRSDMVAPEKVQQIRQVVSSIAGQIPLATSAHRPSGLLHYPHDIEPLDALAGQSVAVLSAIGNPSAFEETVRHCGANIVAARQLPDHDGYDPDTVRDLIGWIRSLPSPIDRIVCTHKDLVKLRTEQLGGKPLSALLIELSLLSGQESLESILNSLVESIAS